MTWDVVVTPRFETWFRSQPPHIQDEIAVVVGLLRERGPTLGRPFAETLRYSAIANLKELRPRGAATTVRIMYAFGPDRRAVLLLGGDKRGSWSAWYRRSIPEAEDLWHQHISSTRSD